MHNIACGNTIMSPDDIIATTKKLLNFVDENLVNTQAKELCEFITNVNITNSLVPHSIAIVIPNDKMVDITPEEVLDNIANALIDNDIQPLPSFPTPRKLYHRKNTIIRLWRMIAPKYEQVGRVCNYCIKLYV